MTFVVDLIEKIKTHKRKKRLIDLQFWKKMGYLGYNKPMKKEEKVIRLVKGEFEVYHDMTADEFVDIYIEMKNIYPEKLI